MNQLIYQFNNKKSKKNCLVLPVSCCAYCVCFCAGHFVMIPFCIICNIFPLKISSIYITTISATCGGSFSGSAGQLTSPGYPGNYEANLDCVWTIRGPAGHFFTITFDALSLQYSSNCSNNDYLEIRDVNATGTNCSLM